MNEGGNSDVESVKLPRRLAVTRNTNTRCIFAPPPPPPPLPSFPLDRRFFGGCHPGGTALSLFCCGSTGKIRPVQVLRRSSRIIVRRRSLACVLGGRRGNPPPHQPVFCGLPSWSHRPTGHVFLFADQSERGEMWFCCLRHRPLFLNPACRCLSCAGEARAFFFERAFVSMIANGVELRGMLLN
jgi:hypothetical protein